MEFLVYNKLDQELVGLKLFAHTSVADKRNQGLELITQDLSCSDSDFTVKMISFKIDDDIIPFQYGDHHIIKYYYTVFPIVQQGSLYDILSQNLQILLSVDTQANLCKDILNSVEYLNRIDGMCHGNVYPGNFMRVNGNHYALIGLKHPSLLQLQVERELVTNSSDLLKLRPPISIQQQHT